jgi:hypothetical protein
MLSPSTKSESASAHRVRSKWRLSQTLRRTVDYRPIEAEDIKYLWAAYKQGAFPDMEAGLEPDEFKETFYSIVQAKFHAVWTLFGPTRKGFIPVGVVFATWAPNGPFLIVTGAVWMPWASKRNIVECMVGFLNGVRKEFALQFYALPEHKRLYEVCAMHGAVRRIGTSYTAIAGKHAAMFETRAP